MLTTFADRVKDQLKHSSPGLLRWLGLELLDKTQTERLLKPYVLKMTDKAPISLPEVTDVFNAERVVFPPKTVQTDPDFLWDYPNATGEAQLLRCGSVQIGEQVPDTDFGNHALLNDLVSPDRRPVQYYPTVMAPWSHYWGGYYDFVFFVAAKLCRLKAALPPETFGEIAVSYPLFHQPFETELLTLLDISSDRIFDSRRHALSFDRCLLANNSSWFYPSARDLLTLKAAVEGQLPPPPDQPSRRLYISRKGRRQVVNEAELTQLLARFGFEVVPDEPRSVAEQVRLYQSADFVLGPHGASFANLLWCRPGTQLLELFAPTYRPEYFRYLAHVLQLRYAAHSAGPLLESHHSQVNADLTVDLDEVEQGLTVLFLAP